ncbi:MAG: NAD-dependent epimerase/dehydratase family protein [Phycisphaerales bacterium]|nr:NAD-dependent epimerase/dehydratase family protein [Phycisphaerales bacterium]
MAASSTDQSTHPVRVLITGGAGFIGSHLVDAHRAKGDEVVVIDDCSTGQAQNLMAHQDQITLHRCDLSEGLSTLRSSQDTRFDLIYHLAAAVGVDLVLEDPIGSIRTNVLQTDALLEFAREFGSPPTFIASSSEVYGRPGASVFSEEDDSIFGPTSVTRWSYAHAKAIDEHLALAYAQQHQLPVVVGRFFNTVGPRQIGRYGMVLPRFVSAALENQPIRVFGDGKQSRCFCDVRDVVTVLPKLLANPDAYGRVMNIGSDRAISILELAELVKTVVGSDSAIQRVEYSEAYPAGFEDLRHRKPDLSRLRSLVEFEYSYSLEETIADLAEQIKNGAPHQSGVSG